MSRQDADNVSATLVATYAAVWAALQEQQRRAVLSGSRRQIREFINQVKAWTQSLDRQTYEWASEQFGTIYGLGAMQGLEPTGDSFQWTPSHEAAATGIAGDVWASLRQANDNVRRSAAKVGHLTREVTRSTTPEELAGMLRQHGAAAVVYKGGARHGLEDYARMLLRTQTSIAFNKAGLAAGKGVGIDWYEVSDGAGCGWESHNDGDEANGKIVPGDEAETHLLAHPNCQRLFSGRPDIRSAEDALAAGAENAGDAPAQAQVDASQAESA